MKQYILLTIAVLSCSSAEANQESISKHDQYLPVCGESGNEPESGINDENLSNAVGVCLKIREIVDPTDGSLKRFTSTPSKATVDALGYTISDTPYNEGNTYAGISPWEPFALFRQDGGKTMVTNGTEGQLARWCQNLNHRAFGERSNWRRATLDELKALYHFDNPYNEDMADTFGWPTYIAYFSRTNVNSNFFSVDLFIGEVLSFSDYYSLYASCVSTQELAYASNR